jgi:hypothetical protein
MKPSSRSAGLVCLLLALPLPALAQQAEPLWSVTGYLEQSWPKQTTTNRQIRQDINGAYGTHFETWDDVPNLNLGVIVLKKVAPKWKVGLDADWSMGSISGTEYLQNSSIGPGSLAFKEKYMTYADLQAIVQVRPLGEEGRVVPYLSAAAGVAYDRDATTIDFTSSLDGTTYKMLRVDNHGFFPVLNLGVGMDVFLSARREWYVEAQAGYCWARLKRDAPASGLAATGTTATDDTDDTGPNVQIGIGRRF